MIKALKIIGYIAGAVGSVWVAFKVVDAIQDSQTDRLEIQQSDSAAQAKYILESTAREEHMVAVVSNTSRKMDSLIGVVNNNHEATINNGLAIIDLNNKDGFPMLYYLLYVAICYLHYYILVYTIYYI